MTDTKKFPVLPSIICSVGFLILVGIGTWQIQRLMWKNALQTQIDLLFSKDASETPLTDADFFSLPKDKIKRGVIEATIDLSQSVPLHGPILNGKSGYAILAPATLNPKTSVMVEVGCREDANLRVLKTMGQKNVMLSGIIRTPDWSYFTPDNNLVTQDYWRADPNNFQKIWNVPTLAPVVMTLENSAEIDASLSPCLVNKTLRNEHLNYAFFWFTMAGALGVIWGLRFLKPYLQSA